MTATRVEQDGLGSFNITGDLRSTRSIHGADLVVRHLEVQGVRHIFGVPGAKIDRVYDALLDSRIQTVVCRHEQNASFIAQGIGRLTGKAGVCLVTSGPGTTNLVTGFATATSEGSPVVGLGGVVPRAVRLKQTHQSLDTATLFRPVAKYSAEVGSEAAIGEVLANAFRAGESPRPGAAFVALPSDVMDAAARRVRRTEDPRERAWLLDHAGKGKAKRGRDSFAVGKEHDARHNSGVAFVSSQHATCFHVPQNHDFVDAARDQTLAVRRERDAPYACVTFGLTPTRLHLHVEEGVDGRRHVPPFPGGAKRTHVFVCCDRNRRLQPVYRIYLWPHREDAREVRRRPDARTTDRDQP